MAAHDTAVVQSMCSLMHTVVKLPLDFVHRADIDIKLLWG